ncbi:hypothetical protein, partial [Altibacter sp.]|uniref:hypothetical protein n=1 Tax=Altibacter sp. TaxID=2024823 RepID=UPI00258BA513
MKQLIVTLCVAFFCSFSGLAQDAIVKGRIVDTKSSEVIPDVEVRILGSIYNTMTDAEGLFTISGTDIPQGEQVLV